MSEKLRDKEFSWRWLFCGESLPKEQNLEMSLQTSLYRVRTEFNLKLCDLLKVESKMMRDFRRKYNEVDRQDVENDTLYCMSLMRHHSAPTRLLDWTYSPFVAAYFALEKWHPKSKPVVVVWCLSDKWCFESFIKAYPELKEALKRYVEVHAEKDISPSIRDAKNSLFNQLFMKDVYDYVYPVNPFHFHIRPNVQQGVFLCPGSISKPVGEILMIMNEKNIDTSIQKPIRKLCWEIKDSSQWLDALDELYRSNISRVSLFPGPDGFAASLNFRLRFYDQLPTYPQY